MDVIPSIYLGFHGRISWTTQDNFNFLIVQIGTENNKWLSFWIIHRPVVLQYTGHNQRLPDWIINIIRPVVSVHNWILSLYVLIWQFFFSFFCPMLPLPCNLVVVTDVWVDGKGKLSCLEGESISSLVFPYLYEFSLFCKFWQLEVLSPSSQDDDQSPSFFVSSQIKIS